MHIQNTTEERQFFGSDFLLLVKAYGKNCSKHCCNSRPRKIAHIKERKDCFSYRKQVRLVS